MKVKRTVTVDTEVFDVGDVIEFELTGREKVQAMAVQETLDGMLFVFVDCLEKEYPMFKDSDGMDEEEITYMNSDLRKALNGEILARFPEKIRSLMVAVNAEGDLLRIPSKKEIFGENIYGQSEDKKVKQWKWMKDRRNRIAFLGKKNAWQWYWLMNRHRDFASVFTLVTGDGNASIEVYCSNFNGVRPVFCLR